MRSGERPRLARTVSGGSRNYRRGFLFAQGDQDGRELGPVERARPYLTASEIGTFGFCRQAWYLERCGVAVTARAQRLRVKGARAHQAIGRRTDQVRTIGRAQRVSGVLLAGLVIALVVVLARGLL